MGPSISADASAPHRIAYCCRRGVARGLPCDTGAYEGTVEPYKIPLATAVVSVNAICRAGPGTDGIDLVAQVTAAQPYTAGQGGRLVVAYDFGIKTTILRYLSTLGRVEVPQEAFINALKMDS